MKIFFTTAIIDNFYSERKQEYIDSFETLSNFLNKQNIYIIECYSNHVNFLENLNPVFYTNTHKDLKNKGVKEAMGLISFILNNKYNIEDNEIIIKQTGRYKLLNNDAINTINNTFFDCYTKIQLEYNQCFTGFFALRFKYLKEFLFNLDLIKMEKESINIEKELYNFITKKNINTYIYSNINLYSNINNESKVIL